jgi:uncharacterized membrane protein
VTIIIIAGALFYPVAATINRVNLQTRPTLDGLAFLSASQKEVIKWLNENAPEKAVILEASGGDYTEAGRIAQWTGIPTVLAWAEHQKIWRGTDQYFSTRPKDIEKLFSSGTTDEIRALLAKYEINYVYIGSLELQKYGEQSLMRFSRFADIVFQNQAATIFKVKQPIR